MLLLWQAHLTFILLGFVLLGSLHCTQRWRPWLLPALAAVSFIPLNDLPVAAYLRSFTDDLAITTLVLLGWASLVRLGVVNQQSLSARVQVLVLFVVLAALLYPATMGLTYVDPYRWGFNPRPLIVCIGVLNLALLWLGNALAVWMLALATLAFALRLKASENYWDYLIDPLLVGYCLVAGTTLCLREVWRLLRPESTSTTSSI